MHTISWEQDAHPVVHGVRYHFDCVHAACWFNSNLLNTFQSVDDCQCVNLQAHSRCAISNEPIPWSCIQIKLHQKCTHLQTLPGWLQIVKSAQSYTQQ